LFSELDPARVKAFALSLGKEEIAMPLKTRPCEICKQPIDPERVDAVPETRLCTDHARAVEKLGGEFIVTATPERTSKPGSLKKNYGSFTTQKTRNKEAIEKLRDEYQRGREQEKT
jgi:hypothetical protein